MRKEKKRALVVKNRSRALTRSKGGDGGGLSKQCAHAVSLSLHGKSGLAKGRPSKTPLLPGSGSRTESELQSVKCLTERR